MGTENEQNQPTRPVEAGLDPLLRDTAVESEISASSPTNAYLGLLLKDRYLIESVIGRGGIGVVYLARDLKLVKRPVVIKVLHQDVVSSELGGWLKKKFQHEIEALSRIDHPGVVGVLDIGEMPDGRAYFVMQYVEGVTLRVAIIEQSLGLDRIAHLVRQMGLALSAAHDKGVLHRDLKPENVMLQNLGGGEEQVKLIDFGIARVADPQIAPETQATKVAGTPPYMAPEQIRGRPSVASDIFSLGAMVYEMVTGIVPYKADTQVALYEAQREGVKVKPRDVRPALPEAAEAAILKALAFDENARYARARDFGDELSLALLGERGAVQKDSFGATAGPQIRETLSTSAGVARETVADAATRVEQPQRRRAVPPAWIAIAAMVVIAAVVAALLLRPKTQSPITTTTAPQRSLNYWVMLQKYRDGKPYQSPAKLPGDILFEKDYRVRFYISGGQPGFLYLINEGPQPINDLPAYVLLFPKPAFNHGSAELKANQEMNTSEFKFDEEQGTEKLWLVWSAAALPELESVKGVGNPKDQGAISNPDQIRVVREFLDKHYDAAKPLVEKDEVNEQTLVKGSGEVLVHLIKLLHN
ncbi:MAG: serine/threonine protein kinase [Blastocatellia bacterium]